MPLINHYSSPSSSLHQLVPAKLHTSSKCNEGGAGYSQSFHRQNPHSAHYQHSHEKPARPSSKRHTHNSNSEFEASSGSELSESLTLRPPATFSDLNPGAKMHSTFQGSQKTSRSNQHLMKPHLPPHSSSPLTSNNQYHSVAEVIEATKAAELTNTSAESLVSHISYLVFCSTVFFGKTFIFI